MKFRQKVIWLASAAAALMIVIAVAALAAAGPEFGKPKQDIVLSQQFTAAPGANPLENIVYYTENGRYFHTVADCSGMAGAQANTMRAAYAAGKGACPVCVDWEKAGMDFEKASVLPTPQTTPEPTPGPTPQATPEPMLDPTAIVYCTKNGTYYHIYSDCSGMMNARFTFPEYAEAEGKVPCPVCLAADANAWFSAAATPEPTRAAAEAALSASERVPEPDIFARIFGMDFAEAFPGYTLNAVTSEPEQFDRGYLWYEFTDSTHEHAIGIDLNEADPELNGAIFIGMDDGAAAEYLIANAPEHLRTLHASLAPGLIDGLAQANGLAAPASVRLSDIGISYSYDMAVVAAEFTYCLPDDSTVHLGWKNVETAPRLYIMSWAGGAGGEG